MAKKLFFQFAVMLVSFFSVWFLLSNINFTGQEDLSKFSDKGEAKLGRLILQSVKRKGTTIDSPEINAIVDSIAFRLYEGSAIDQAEIKIHIINNPEINAFALPDKNMIIYSGLIEYTKTPEELAGVMAHEIGHIRKNHVMEKLSKEIGMSMLFTIIAGDAGFEIIRELARTASSTAFDREQEKEADAFAVTLMTKAHIDPEHLANFLFRLSLEKGDIPEELFWMSTHPDSKDRSVDILQQKKGIPEPIRKEAYYHALGRCKANDI